ASLNPNHLPSRKGLTMTGQSDDDHRLSLRAAPARCGQEGHSGEAVGAPGPDTETGSAPDGSQVSAAAPQEGKVQVQETALPPPTQGATGTSILAETPEAIRAEAAEVAQVCAQAARLGISIDAA